MNWSFLPNITRRRIEALASIGVHAPQDLLTLAPRRYIDRRVVVPLSQIADTLRASDPKGPSRQPGQQVTVIGRIEQIREAGYGRKKRLEVIIRDQNAVLTGVWFRGMAWLRKTFESGQEVAFFGEVKRFGRGLSMAHPEVEILTENGDTEAMRRLVPVYPSSGDLSSAKITNRMLQQWIERILRHHESASGGRDPLPEAILRTAQLPSIAHACRLLHQPESPEDHALALRRLKFDEFFLFECAMARVRSRQRERQPGLVIPSPGPLTRRFFNEILPFELTEGQKQALQDIRRDLASGVQMNRLVQGDVGAGKTVVSIGAMLMAVDAGAQAAMMAPTEILAEQHHATLERWLSPLGIRIRLLKGGQSGRLREDVLTDLLADPLHGGVQIVVGTHAIIQDQVRFARLGLAVIDEQHRFGVEQRSMMLAKGSHPHLLVMSATPIPRSLALSLYSDLDITAVKGLPAGRQPVRTAVRNDSSRDDLYGFVRGQLGKGGQAYVVYPLIEESEAIDLKDATAGYEQLRDIFPDHGIGLIHGRMKAEEKDAIMARFASGELRVLVSTTVIEVGVDVANANIMIIEHAERFGLSQLHQLRGRVGRGSRESFCVLMHGTPLGNSARFRLRKMVETTDGFEIAEADLKLRGPGDFLGTRQSGLPEFRFGDIVEDQALLLQAKDLAWELMGRDPDLSDPSHQGFKAVFEPYFASRMAFFGK